MDKLVIIWYSLIISLFPRCIWKHWLSLNISKAFDKVWYKFLIYKLNWSWCSSRFNAWTINIHTYIWKLTKKCHSQTTPNVPWAWLSEDRVVWLCHFLVSCMYRCMYFFFLHKWFLHDLTKKAVINYLHRGNLGQEFTKMTTKTKNRIKVKWILCKHLKL